MDSEGEEKIEDITDMLRALLEDAKLREQLTDDWYYLSDRTLGVLKLLQGFDASVYFPGRRLEQAFRIWKQAPRCLVDAVLRANGFEPLTHPFGTLHIRLQAEESGSQG